MLREIIEILESSGDVYGIHISVRVSIDNSEYYDPSDIEDLIGAELKRTLAKNFGKGKLHFSTNGSWGYSIDKKGNTDILNLTFEFVYGGNSYSSMGGDIITSEDGSITGYSHKADKDLAKKVKKGFKIKNKPVPFTVRVTVNPYEYSESEENAMRSRASRY